MSEQLAKEVEGQCCYKILSWNKTKLNENVPIFFFFIQGKFAILYKAILISPILVHVGRHYSIIKAGKRLVQPPPLQNFRKRHEIVTIC